MLLCFEALLLFALDEQDGCILDSIADSLEHILAGAVLTELVLQKRITLSDDRVTVENATPTEHPVLDEALFVILETTRLRKYAYWINTLAYKSTVSKISQNLINQGILKRKKKHLLLAGGSSDQFNSAVSERFSLKAHLREIVLAGREPEPSEMLLLAFVHDADMVKLIFTHGERKTAHKRLRKMFGEVEGESPLGMAAHKIITAACKKQRRA
jgi:hypothetical protein